MGTNNYATNCLRFFVNRYLALALLPLSCSVMAFHDEDQFGKLLVGADYTWTESHYVFDGIELGADVSPVFNIGFDVSEKSQFLASFHDELSLVTLTYKRKFPEWAFSKDQGFIPYFSVGAGMGEEDYQGAELKLFSVQAGVGVDYRVNSILELTAGVSLSEQQYRFEYESNSDSSHGLSKSVSFGVRIYPF